MRSTPRVAISEFIARCWSCCDGRPGAEQSSTRSGWPDQPGQHMLHEFDHPVSLIHQAVLGVHPAGPAQGGVGTAVRAWGRAHRGLCGTDSDAVVRHVTAVDCPAAIQGAGREFSPAVCGVRATRCTGISALLARRVAQRAQPCVRAAKVRSAPARGRQVATPRTTGVPREMVPFPGRLSRAGHLWWTAAVVPAVRKVQLLLACLGSFPGHLARDSAGGAESLRSPGKFHQAGTP
mmetsp:Transcript_13894/g.35760  ORF Transcript_13894/g.35760 Transcript_13894/m.35760 type:complete len:235 (-) Transcript_13894:357-1061(-)